LVYSTISFLLFDFGNIQSFTKVEVFNLFLHVAIGLNYSFYRIINDLDRLNYPFMQGRTLYRVKNILLKSIVNGAFLTVTMMFISSVSYLIVGNFLFRKIFILLGSFGFKFADQHFSYWLPFSLFVQLRMFPQICRIIACFEATNAIFELYFTMVKCN
jgi:hypothetical protein